MTAVTLYVNAEEHRGYETNTGIEGGDQYSINGYNLEIDYYFPLLRIFKLWYNGEVS